MEDPTGIVPIGGVRIIGIFHIILANGIMVGMMLIGIYRLRHLIGGILRWFITHLMILTGHNIRCMEKIQFPMKEEIGIDVEPQPGLWLEEVIQVV